MDYDGFHLTRTIFKLFNNLVPISIFIKLITRAFSFENSGYHQIQAYITSLQKHKRQKSKESSHFHYQILHLSMCLLVFQILLFYLYF